MSNSQYGPYSNMKLTHHRERILASRNTTAIPAPVNVQLVISNRCNLNCKFCTYRNDMFPSAQGNFKRTKELTIPTEKVFEIINDCKTMGVKSITLTGGGEPSVHVSFGGIVRKIITAGLELGLITNGIKMPKDVLMNINNPAFQWVRVSLDAGNPATYSVVKECNPGLFHKVIGNIEQLVCYKHYCESNITVGVGFVVSPDNFNSIFEATKIVKNIGVDSFRIRSVSGTALADYYGDRVEIIKEICKQAQSESTDTFTVENLFRDDIAVIQHSSTCGYRYLHTYIGADLNVYNCCLYAYNDIGLKGNLAKMSFRDYWQSDAHLNYMKQFNPAKCPTCDFVAKNEMIEYLGNTNPVNVNFI
jgi:uncharacterized protein